MNLNDVSMASLESKYYGYLEGDVIDEFFHDFGIKFAAGHWAAGGFADRFAPAGYDPSLDNTIIAQLERIGKAKIAGIELLDNLFTGNNDNKKDNEEIRIFKEALARLGIQPANMGINLYSNPKWKLGGITNTNKEIRKDALDIAHQAVEIAAEIGCKSVSLWPGSDGWDYNFEVDYGRQLELFVDGCISVNNKARSMGLVFGIEAKPHEPREGNNILSTSHLAILIAKMVNAECGGNNMGVVIDYGHEQMNGLEPASMLYVARAAGVLVINFHLNDAKFRSNDEDRIAGTSDIWRLVDFCYAAVDTNYDGWFGEDQFTYRTDPVKSMILTREFFANAMRKALLIYGKKDKLESARATGDAIATIEAVKKYLY